MNALFDKYFIKQPRFRRWVTRVLEGDENVQIDLLGAKLTINSIKEHGYLRASRIAQRSSLFRDEVSVLINLAWMLNGADTFIDVGANVGLFSLVFARFRRIFPSLEIHAFEANPDTYQRLIVETANLGIHTHLCALSDREGSVDFVGGAVSHVFAAAQNSSCYSIPSEQVTLTCKRLDSFQFQGASIILKIDVEGHENEVLKGASGLFEQQRIRAVYIDGYRDLGIPAYLLAHGFAIYDGRTLKPSDRPFSLLAIHRDAAE